MPVTAAHQQQDPQSTASPSRSNRATAARLADAAMHARRNSCCVADFANVAVNARPVAQQAQLEVSSVGDAHEREAQAAADRVSRVSESETPNDVSVPSTRSRDGGNIDHHTRSMMQRGFGADFSDVRLHTDDRAASMSRSLNARAFTVGRDIYFGSGEYSPTTVGGRHLLAHELTHTLQQNPARIQRSPTAQGLTGLGVNVEEQAESGGGETEFGNVAVHGVRPFAISRVAPMIQRSAKWNGIIGPHDNINVAEMVFGGPKPVSWAMLNGKMLKQEAHADDAMKGKEPAVKTRASRKGAKAKLTTAPAQEGAVDETVVSQGPWTKAMKKSDVGAVFNLPACAGGDPTTFSAKGVRTDKEVADANLRHENKHCGDIEDAFKDTVVAWDKKVQAAKKAGTEYEGTDAPDATTNLWAAMGDTPIEMSRKFRALSLSKGDDYHKKPEGKEMTATRAWASADCSTCGVDIVNPS